MIHQITIKYSGSRGGMPFPIYFWERMPFPPKKISGQQGIGQTVAFPQIGLQNKKKSRTKVNSSNSEVRWKIAPIFGHLKIK